MSQEQPPKFSNEPAESAPAPAPTTSFGGTSSSNKNKSDSEKGPISSFFVFNMIMREELAD